MTLCSIFKFNYLRFLVCMRYCACKCVCMCTHELVCVLRRVLFVLCLLVCVAEHEMIRAALETSHLKQAIFLWS